MRVTLAILLLLMPMACRASSPGEVPLPPSAEQAEMMGLVEWVSMHSGRDVTARKSIEWGDIEKHDNGNRSIRYKYYATIWDRKMVIMNQVFTFDSQGSPISMKHVHGYPQPV